MTPNKTLILTGFHYPDYAVAAALTLRQLPDAEVLAMSKNKLPEFLEEMQGYAKIVILGVSLGGDVDRLGKVLERLKSKQVKVIWVSGIDFPQWIGDEVRGNLESHVSPSGSISVAVEEYYGLKHDETLDALADQATELGRAYENYRQAAEYYFRYYQDRQMYSGLIRHLSAGDPKSRWSESERRMIERFCRYGHRPLIGESAPIRALRERIGRVAKDEHARVLILGESGTGKETVAQEIFLHSPRKDASFVAFNCASVTPNLLEDRFLGHEKGAFTGANEQRKGIFEAANGGTLFLDEIGELPLEAQGVLLRVLEEGRFQRLGGNGKDTPEVEVDVRVIAATNRDLAELVREKKFRADLYYRLCAIQLKVPPLREHKDDIPLIANSYRMNNQMGGRLTREQVAALQSYDFPGNVRELQNLLVRAHVLGITDFGELIREHEELNASLTPPSQPEVPDNLDEVIRLHVRQVCAKYSNNYTKAAEALGVSRNTVRKHLGLAAEPKKKSKASENE